jgi:hypothetical protein
LALAVVAALALPVVTTGAVAQGWWPWSQDNTRQQPTPREPVYRAPPPQQQPPPVAQPGGPQSGWTPAPQASRPGGSICLQLEQRLVAEGQRGNASRDQLPKLEQEIRQLDRAYAAMAQRLDNNCYDTFLFAKSLRQTPQCRDLSGQVEATKRRIADLDAQRQQILGTRDRSYQDDIIRELARNGCGQQYVQEAKKRDGAGPFSSLWSDDEAPVRGGGGSWGAMPFATYRTICVRLCDGYFFPVSFSTLPNHFQRDADACQSQCAAPAELYYYQNPGGAVEQAVSVKNQTPYTSLRTAFRFRKELAQGCSCKAAEYVPAAGDRRADGLPAATPGQAAQAQPPAGRVPQAR